MPPAPASLISALADRYVVERELGAGGMATVYLARDLRHDRRVALKVLRPELSAILGGERFLQEIRTTANLQHPHILSLFDSGTADGFVFYVMPYVEGESLRDRLTREHQLPVDDAISIASEVADALQYAHEHGVIHRDIKPENVLLHGGHAMVADFGIALAASRSDGSTRMTDTGLSLGTPAYMAPEQAMGEREISPRADIYALGVVLYEMLSGEPPFAGPTAQAIVARMMTEEPRSLIVQRHSVPPNVEAAVRRALEKLPADRFGSAAEFRTALNDPRFAGSGGTLIGRPAVRPTPRGRVLAAAPWVLAAGALALAGALLFRPRAAPPVTRYVVALPGHQKVLEYRATPSPDGSLLIFVGRVPGQMSDANFQLWLKHRDRFDAEPVPGTTGAWNATFSPDSRSVAFIGGGRLFTIGVGGGTPVELADSAAPAQPGIAWLDDGTIVFAKRGGKALLRVPSGGGAAETVYRSAETIFEPAPLPGARAVLAGTCADATCSSANLVAVDLRAGTSSVIIRGVGYGHYVSSGHLIFVRDQAAFAAPFDARSRRLTGAPVVIVDTVGFTTGSFGIARPTAEIAASDAGTLVYRRGGAQATGGQYEMVWVDRSGSATPIDMGGNLKIDPGGGNPGWALSPDGRRLAIGLATASGGDIWVKELPNGPMSRVTFDTMPDMRPRWLPDGRRLTFVADRHGYELHEVSADGTGAETVLARHPHGIFEGAVSPDGKWIVARTRGGLGHQARDIVGFHPGDTTAVPLIASAAFDESAFRLSPDGRWIAYESDETGRREIYVRPFPNTDDGKWQASTQGGSAPLWAPDGRELFFVDAERRMTSMAFTPGGPPTLGARRVLFPLSGRLYLAESDYYAPYDISPDGRRFLMARLIEADSTEVLPLMVVDNWVTELRGRLQ
ncbi:MAG: protein kinase [Gemmatimonadota bacterium]